MSWKYGAWEEQIDFTIKVFSDDNYTRVDLLDEMGESVAKGVARRDPSDVPNFEIGVDLATARAFASYANKKNRRAKGLIKHADEVQELKEEKKSAALFVETMNRARPPTQFLGRIYGGFGVDSNFRDG